METKRKRDDASRLQSAERPIRNAGGCVDALTQAIEEIYPSLDVTVHVLRLIAELTPYGE